MSKDEPVLAPLGANGPGAYITDEQGRLWDRLSPIGSLDKPWQWDWGYWGLDGAPSVIVNRFGDSAGAGRMIGQTSKMWTWQFTQYGQLDRLYDFDTPPSAGKPALIDGTSLRAFVTGTDEKCTT
jgi:hypothetical protein